MLDETVARATVTPAHTVIYGGGGDGLFLACEDFGRMFDNSFPACVFIIFFLKWR